MEQVKESRQGLGKVDRQKYIDLMGVDLGEGEEEEEEEEEGEGESMLPSAGVTVLSQDAFSGNPQTQVVENL